MPTPNSGGSPNPTNDITANLGDTSKLSFLADLDAAGTDEDGDTAITESIEESQSTTHNEDGSVVVERRVEDPATETETETETETVEEEVPPHEVEASAKPTSKEPGYEGFTADEVKLLKQMSNPARAFVTARLAEQAKLKKDLEDAQTIRADFDKIKDREFYHHDKAYTLSPEYHEAERSAANERFAAQHWQEQLAAIEEGQPFFDLLRDKTTGALSINPTPIQPSPAYRAQVIRAMSIADSRASGLEAKLETLQSSYKAKFTSYDNKLAEIENEVLGEIRKHPEFKALEEAMIKRFPSELRHSKKDRLIAGQWAYIQALIQQIAQLKGKSKINGVKKKIARRQGPGDSAAAERGSSTGEENIETLTHNLMTHIGRS